MNALTLDDLLPLEEFAGRRREFFEAHARYLDRYRRVRIGPGRRCFSATAKRSGSRCRRCCAIARLAEPVAGAAGTGHL